jgi:hypothetical protein
MTKHHAFPGILRPSRAQMVNDKFPTARRYGFELVDAQNRETGATIRASNQSIFFTICRRVKPASISCDLSTIVG